jgi:hypothetical protein
MAICRHSSIACSSKHRKFARNIERGDRCFELRYAATAQTARESANVQESVVVAHARRLRCAVRSTSSRLRGPAQICGSRINAYYVTFCEVFVKLSRYGASISRPRPGCQFGLAGTAGCCQYFPPPRLLSRAGHKDVGLASSEKSGSGGEMLGGVLGCARTKDRFRVCHQRHGAPYARPQARRAIVAYVPLPPLPS